MAEPSQDIAKAKTGGSRIGVAIVGALLVFCVCSMMLWALTTLTLTYALIAASPVTLIAVCCIVAIDAVGEFVSAVLEAVGTIIAGIFAAIAAVFN